jgi:N-ATPase, AtpR subunit
MEAVSIKVTFVILGAITGALHFALLRRNVGSLVAGGSPLRAVGAILLRFVLTVGIFLWAAVAHGLVVLWVLGGFVLTRSAAVRVVRAGV